MKYEAHISELNDRLQKISNAPKGIDQPRYQTGNVAKKNLLETILFVITLLVVSLAPIATQKQKLVVLTDGVYVLEKSLFLMMSLISREKRIQLFRRRISLNYLTNTLKVC